jgi:thioredoxin 1
MKIKLIDFWAEWCGPCKILSPFIDQIKEELSDNDNIEIIKINVDENPEMAREYSIRSIPTILLINSETNEIVDKIIGMQPKSRLLEIIKEKLDQ